MLLKLDKYRPAPGETNIMFFHIEKFSIFDSHRCWALALLTNDPNMLAHQVLHHGDGAPMPSWLCKGYKQHTFS